MAGLLPASDIHAEMSDLEYEVGELHIAYEHELDRYAHAQHVSRQELSALTFLHTEGPSTPSAIAHRLGRTTGGTTKLVDALKARDLITRRPHPSDRRSLIVHLTSKGTELGSGFFPALHHSAAAATIRNLATAQATIDVLRRMTADINDNQ